MDVVVDVVQGAAAQEVEAEQRPMRYAMGRAMVAQRGQSAQQRVLVDQAVTEGRAWRDRSDRFKKVQG